MTKWKQNNSYWILGAAVVLIMVLGYFQMQWLDEAAEAQRRRIEDQIVAGSKAFSAEFSKELAQLKRMFSQVNDEGDLEKNLMDAHQSWTQKTDYEHLLKSVWVFRQEEGKKSGKRFDPSVLATEAITTAHIDSLLNRIGTNLQTTLEVGANKVYLGEPSYMLISSFGSGRSFQSQNGFDFSGLNLFSEIGNAVKNSFIFIELNNEALKEDYLPEKFSELFGADFSSIYQLAMLSQNTEDSIFYATEYPLEEEPFRTQVIEEIRSQIIMMYGNKDMKIEKGISSGSGFSIRTKEKITSDSVTSQVNVSSVVISESGIDLKKQFPDLFDNISSISINKDRFNAESDGSGIELQVFIKGGSLGEYIQRTKMLNSGISLLILLCLGGSVFFVTLTANRSQKLADQQMMFVAGISHELKTPVSVIKSAASNLEDGVITKPEQIKEYGGMIAREGDRLNRMIHQVLHMAGIQTDQMTITKESLQARELVDQVLEEMNAYLKSQDKVVKVNIHPESLKMIADRASLKQVITNLIQNAVKYSPDHNEIHIIGREQSGKSELLFRDFGQGISEKDQKHVFEPFYRGENAQKKQIQGNGLGLYLVKQLCNKQNVQVTLKSALEVGTTVILSFGDSYE